MVLTAFFVLSPVIGLFVTVASAMRSIVANLTPASRHQDHTTSPSAFGAFVSCTGRVHRIPLPTSVTTAKRPSFRERDGGESAFDLPDVTSENACGTLARRANQQLKTAELSSIFSNSLGHVGSNGKLREQLFGRDNGVSIGRTVEGPGMR